MMFEQGYIVCVHVIVTTVSFMVFSLVLRTRLFLLFPLPQKPSDPRDYTFTGYPDLGFFLTGASAVSKA